MNETYKIVIVGVGGVGGFVGTKLASAYGGSPVKIIFLSREQDEKAIKENGIKLISDGSYLIAFPSLVTTDPEQLRLVDMVICCTKTYQLEESLSRLHQSLKETTVFLPLLNGVTASAKIKKLFPEHTVLEGCIYLISRKVSPGVIRQSGTLNQLCFGKEESSKDLSSVEEIFNVAGLNVLLTDNIKNICWEKFFLISSMATLTSYLNTSIGEILANENHRALLVQLMNELKELAEVKEIYLPGDINERTLKKLSAMPYDGTSSMHADFQNGNLTELDELTGYVVNEASLHNLKIPTYKKMYDSLKTKIVVRQ